jgi:outer membrane protein assembly factor BamB
MGYVGRIIPDRRGRAAGVAVALSVAMLALFAGGTHATAASAHPRTSASPDNWPTFHHDVTHSGISPDTVIDATSTPTLTEAWSQVVGGKKANFVYGSPAVVYNATLGETVVYDGSENGYVDAFNAANGDVIWQADLDSPVEASPAVDGNTVYFADLGGTLTAFNATTGAVECSVTLPITPPQTAPPRILSSPAVGYVDSTGPILYFGDVGTKSGNQLGHEWAVTGYGNTGGSCQVKWSFNAWNNPGKNLTGSWSPPALTQTSSGEWLDVFGSANPDDSVYALNAETGALVWRFQSDVTGPDTDVGAGPTISAPRVNGFKDGVVYVDGKDTIEYALDLATGAQIWSFDMGTDTGASYDAESTAALTGNDLVVDFDYYLYEFNATTGAVIWRVALPDSGGILGSPAVSGPAGHRVVFIGDLSDNEYGFQLTTGKLLWTYKGTSSILSSTAVSDGMIFYGDNGGSLLAFAPSS